MHATIRLAAMALSFAVLAPLPRAAQAETYQTCAGFIESLPASISTQGIWCLRKDLSTGMTDGNAITLATNNVVIDCNGFKLGGLAAGDDSVAIGIFADGRQNAAIRNCNIRGFYYGVYLNGGAGHLVEDNRFDNNLYTGVMVDSDNSRVRRNAVYDTGGATGMSSAIGIASTGDVVDNTISGLFADVPSGFLGGITLYGAGGEARGNKVSGFDRNARQGGQVSLTNGIYLTGAYQRASGNHIVAGGANPGTGILALTPTSYCLENTVGGFVTNIDTTCNASGNLTAP